MDEPLDPSNAPAPGVTSDPPVATSSAQPAVQTADPGGTSDSGVSDVSSKPSGGELPAAAPPEDWRDKRFAKTTARMRELERQLEAAKAAQAPGATPDEAAINAKAEERARAIAAQRAFDEKCNEVADQGRKVHKDFDTRVTDLRKLVDDKDPESVASYMNLVQAVLRTGERAADVLHSIGGDLNEASRIMSLSPAEIGTEIGRLAYSSEGAISKAPRPLQTTVGSRSAQHESVSPDDPNRADSIPIEVWMERREAQMKARRKAS